MIEPGAAAVKDMAASGHGQEMIHIPIPIGRSTRLHESRTSCHPLPSPSQISALTPLESLERIVCQSQR